MLTVTEAHDPVAWNSFLASQQFRPFLQSWEMGEVYREIGQEPVRLEVQENGNTVGICFGHIVSARRGRHLSIPYGPILGTGDCPPGRAGRTEGLGTRNILELLLGELTRIAKDAGCSFIRMSPFWTASAAPIFHSQFSILNSPLHLLAEHLWYLPLVESDPWSPACNRFETPPTHNRVSEETIFKSMRATTRNLIRRAEKEGVTITTSNDPLRDLPLFLKLHEETRRRHSFTPYTDAFFRAQVKHFPSPRSPFEPDDLRASNGQVLGPRSPSCSLYLANYKGEVIAASIHVHFSGETSYHHGASSQKYRNIPASYLLQWRAIQDAIAHGDHIYNFWGIAPLQGDARGIFLQEKQPQELRDVPLSPCKKMPCRAQHPFAGVTLFKTGFGGKLLELQHCMDLPLSPMYYLTRSFETLRKWRRGF